MRHLENSAFWKISQKVMGSFFLRVQCIRHVSKNKKTDFLNTLLPVRLFWIQKHRYILY